MDYTHLGRTGLSVSRAVLGTMNFGPQTTEDDSHAIMDRAHELGVNFFDTANVYGWEKGEGITEQIIGRWFARGGGRREKTVLATKLYGDMGDWPNDGKLSALNIRRALDASLTRLQTDHIDLYQFHHVDRETPWDEIWQAMEVAVQQGKVLYVGSSNFAGWHIAQAQEAAKTRHFTGLVSEQSIYNLIVRDVERETLPAARHYGLGMIPWSPLNGGLLGGVIEKTEEGSRRLEGRSAEYVAEHRDQLEAYESFARELGHAPGEVALAWLLHQPGVTGPITGPRTMAQLESAVAAVDVTLDEAALARLDEIFPGHKTSPEDYAW
ncbi:MULTISPECIES: aldo/keto reductase [unclassified Frigoribacterium]|jgi:aryl-alcohol dehydrogenase-like predicted oxidoreductase|uniref:aldo/keto reductase n=1 Tax=unclassified Frigoribacterium TaxID=2627005 RepID=UPI0005BA02AB|nr:MULTISPECIES: aldo/keto reductase [unclassified Frigoribacterium]KIU03094.1 oxidoreductase [Frigoribacterium sp. MEB024]KQN46031.1 oxidoreductase [Frigoribacterium sp. Leaf44]MBD8539536.1 aldo/keto reductase [Frigoribacterium sp. CFBP 8751]